MNYLLESALILGLLVGFYKLVLHNKPNFSFNRFFLLTSLMASIVLPLVHIGILEPSGVDASKTVDFVNLLAGVTVYSEEAKNSLSAFIRSLSFYHCIYFCGLLFLLARMYLGFIELEDLSNSRRWKTKEGLRIVHIPGNFGAFSFFNLIFLNKDRYQEQQIDIIIEHEKTHVRYKHSYDIVLLEILILFQWFNPFVWILRKLLCEVHEFQVDRSVLRNGISRGLYKALLLEQVTGNRFLPISGFTGSLTKKRFLMMNLENNSKYLSYYKLMAVGVLFSVALLFSLDKKLVSVPVSLLSNDEVLEKVKPEAESINNETNLPRQEKVVHISRKKKMTEAKRVFFTMEPIEAVQPEAIPQKKSTRSYYNKNIKKTVEAEVFNVVDEMPVFPGGMRALRRFIGENVRYPYQAQMNNISGKVYVNFIVDTDGTIIEPTISKGVHDILDYEAIRVVNRLPKWIPGKLNGQLVKVAYTVPINFVLTN